MMLDIIHGRRFPLIVRKHFSVVFHFCDCQRAAKVDFVTILLVMMLPAVMVDNGAVYLQWCW